MPLTGDVARPPASATPRTGRSRALLRALVLSTTVPLSLLLSGAIFWLVPGFRLVHSNGTSMEPGLKQDDLLILRSAGGDSVRVGDVVAFRRGGRPILHRVVEMKRDRGGKTVLVTKGDNNNASDAPTSPELVEAKLVLEVPLVGALSRALGLGGGFEFYRHSMLLLALLWLAVWTVRARRRLNLLAALSLKA